MCLAIPGMILSVEGADPLLRTGRVRFGGIIKEVNLGFVPEAGPGDYVVVHAGVALTRVDEAEAERTWEWLRSLGEDAETDEAPGRVP